MKWDPEDDIAIFRELLTHKAVRDSAFLSTLFEEQLAIRLALHAKRLH